MPKSIKRVKLKVEFTNSVENGGSYHYLVIEPKSVERMEFSGKTRRVLCSINGAEAFPAALMPWGEIFYIMMNKKRRAELGLEPGDKVDVVLELDESKYGMPMPEELEEVLRQDPEGDKLFHSLTAGKQRSMMYYIGKLKDVDRRIHASLIFLEHLKNNEGKIIYQTLTKELRRPVL